MKHKLTLSITAALVAASLWGSPAQLPWQEDTGVALAAQADYTRAKVYGKQDFRLKIPSAYDRLLITKAVDSFGMLFSVAERASVEATPRGLEEDTGAGWLFTIGFVGEQKISELMENDVPGQELFAKDGEGNFYLYYHPTDVRYVRESPEAMERDQGQWRELNEWAWDSVRQEFLKDNPQLVPYTAEDWQVNKEMAARGVTPAAFLGGWADKTSGRCYIEIKQGREKHAYDVKINWGDSANRTYVWEMTALALDSHQLCYRDARHYSLTFDGKGGEKQDMKYENGRGIFTLNSANEIMWQDETGHAGDDAVFITVK